MRCEEGRADEWAEKQYQAVLEVWKIQGNVPSAVFFRTIYDWLLSSFFGKRIEAVSLNLASEGTPTDRRSRRHIDDALNKFIRAAICLDNRWKRKMNVAAIESEYEAQAIPPTAPVSSASKPKAKRTAKALTSTEKKRSKVIFGAIQAEDKGQEYCKTLNDRKLAIPDDWIQGGCPRTYTDAYQAGQPWQKRIQDEKSRYKKKYDKTPAAEREKLLQ